MVQDKKREHENEEISAYFNQRTSRDRGHDPALSRRTQTKKERHLDNREHSDLREGGSSPILPDEELTSIPYLGFGSKGTINQSGNPQPSATTYLTWSESAAGSDNGVWRAANAKFSRESGQPSTSKKAQQRRPELDLTSRPPSDTAELSVRKGPPDVPRGQWSISRSTQGPDKMEVYVQPSNREPNPSTSKPTVHDSTSMSLPLQPQAKPARQRQQKIILDQQALSSDVGSFNTSDILKVKGRLEALGEEAPPTIRSARVSHSDKENVQPVSSSPTAKLLRIAHETMAKGYEEPIRRLSRAAHHAFRRVEEDHRGHDSHAPKNQGPQPNRPHLQDLDVDDIAYRSVPRHDAIRRQGVYQQAQHDAENVPALGFDLEDDDMLDGYGTNEPTLAKYEDAIADHLPTHTYATPDARPAMHFLSFRYDGPPTRSHEIPWSRGGTSATHRNHASHAATLEQGLMNEEGHIGDRDFDDGLEGFWRPNRLY